MKDDKLSFMYGKVLREIRKDLGIERQVVTEDCHIDLAKIELGERLVRLDNLHCLCWYYKVNIADVVDRVALLIRSQNRRIAN